MNGLFAQDVRETIIFEEFNSTSLSKVIRTLKNKYKVKFAYDDALISGLTITGSYNNMSILDFLDEVLPENGIDYQILNGKFILIPKAIETDPAVPTLFNFTLNGVVRDRLTGETLPNALVRVAGSDYGTVTNKDGRFYLPNVPTDTSTIEVSYLGYKVNNTQLTPEDNKRSVDVEMREHTTNIKGVTVESIPNETVKIGEDVGQMSINPRSLGNIPSLGELDIFRSLQLLPGVSGTDETSGGLSIRGSEPSQNLTLFDGFTLYQLDHFYGVYSAINADAVKDIQIFKSGFAPKYGNRIGGVIDITGKSGNRNKPEFDIGLNLLSARAAAQAPLFGKKGSFIIAGRRAFTDILQTDLYKKLIGRVRDNSTELQDLEANSGSSDIIPDFSFYDINAKISYQPDRDQLLSLSFYKGNDDLMTNFSGQVNDMDDVTIDEDGSYGNEGIGLSWSRQWNRQYYSTLTLGRSTFNDDYTYNSQIMNNGNNVFDYALIKTNQITEAQFNFHNEVTVNREHKVDFGIKGSRIEMFHRVEVDNREDSEVSVDGVIYGIYFNEHYTPNEQVTIQAGLRYTSSGLTLENFISPRLSVFLRPSKSFALKFMAGRYQQLIHQVIQDDVFTGNQNFWTLADNQLKPMRSTNLAAGFNYSKNGWIIDTEYFYKSINNLSRSTVSHISVGGAPRPELDFAQGTGQINGIDVLIQKNTRVYSGWLAYTHLNSTSKFTGLTDFEGNPIFRDINNGERLPALQDQGHEIKLVNMLDFKRFNFSSTWIYGSGKPFLEPQINFIRDNQDRIIEFEVVNTEKTVKRLPVYNRIDVSAAYKFGNENFGGELGISILNVLGKVNVRGKALDTGVITNAIGDTRAPSNDELFRDLTLLDFTPSIFLNIKF